MRGEEFHGATWKDGTKAYERGISTYKQLHDLYAYIGDNLGNEGKSGRRQLSMQKR